MVELVNCFKVVAWVTEARRAFFILILSSVRRRHLDPLGVNQYCLEISAES